MRTPTLGRVTHYDMKLSDGTILEGVAFEDIQVTNASLAEGHEGHGVEAVDDDDENLEEESCPHDKVHPGMSHESYMKQKMREEKIREAIRGALKKGLLEKFSKKINKKSCYINDLKTYRSYNG